MLVEFVFLLHDLCQLPYLSCDLSSIHSTIPPFHLLLLLVLLICLLFFFSFYLKIVFSSLHLLLRLSDLLLMWFCYHIRPTAQGKTNKKTHRKSQTSPYLCAPSGYLVSLRLRFFMTVPLLFTKSYSSYHARLGRSRDTADCLFSCIFVHFKRDAVGS